MDELQKSEKQQIRNLVRDPKWGAIQRAADVLIAHINENPTDADTAFETAKLALSKEKRIEGIRNFIQKLNQIAGE